MKTLLKGEDYDITIPVIQCNADKIGAKVFVVRIPGQLPCRVLAYNEDQATQYVQECVNEDEDLGED